MNEWRTRGTVLHIQMLNRNCCDSEDCLIVLGFSSPVSLRLSVCELAREPYRLMESYSQVLCSVGSFGVEPLCMLARRASFTHLGDEGTWPCSTEHVSGNLSLRRAAGSPALRASLARCGAGE